MSKPLRIQYEEWGLDPLLQTYPGLSVRPNADDSLLISGQLRFRATSTGNEEIADSYNVELRVQDIPQAAPCGQGGRSTHSEELPHQSRWHVVSGRADPSAHDARAVSNST